MKKTGHSRYNKKNMARAICFVFAFVCASSMVAEGESRLQIRSVVRADARTGRLIRTSIVKKAAPNGTQTSHSTPKQVDPLSPPAAEVGVIVQRAAALHGVDPALVHSVIAVESGFNPLAVSPKGAQGLMQLIPATARRFGVIDSFDAQQNIEAGVKYLRYLQDMFHDDRLALAAYNAGEGAVQKYGGVPPYRETEEYVRKVGVKLESARLANSAQVVESNNSLPQPNEFDSGKADSGAEPVRALALFTDETGRIHFGTRDRLVGKTLRTP